MENHGLIIRQLRTLAKLTVQQASKKIGRSVGWISEIENAKGTCALSEKEFNRIVDLLDGAKHRSMFRIWVANVKNKERIDKSCDGAVLKFIRGKKEINLAAASKLTGLSAGYISKLESGKKPVTLDMRTRLMRAYGYSPSSFKNLATDPIRSKAVPPKLKLRILLNGLTAEQIDQILQFTQDLSNQPGTKPGNTNQAMSL